MKCYRYIVVFLLLPGLCLAQSDQKIRNNALSLEIGKTGLIYNLNFDHRFNSSNFGIRAGVGSNFSKYLSAFRAGGGFYYLVKSLELGIDLDFLAIDEVSDDQK